MGFQDRDYNRTSSPTYSAARRGTFSQMRLWSITVWLIIINVAVYVIDIPLNHALYNWGAFSISTAIWHWEIWRFITFQFLHASPGHIFFNMLALYFFGPLVEDYLGSRRYLAFYLLSGIGGAASFVMLYHLHILIENPYVGLVGASAGIFGILIAATRVAPDTTVMLMFPPIPMKLKMLAWIMIAIAVYTVVLNGTNAGGEAAHLGGAAVGALLMQFPRSLKLFDFSFRRNPYRPKWR